MPPGIARSGMDQHLPWLLTADTNTVVLANTSDSKRALSIAELIAYAASKHGIMDCSFADYDLAQMLQESLTV